MRRLFIEQDDRHAWIRVEPPLAMNEIQAGLPSVQHGGSEGTEWIPPSVLHTDHESVIAFESWVFGASHERLTSYAVGLMHSLHAQVIIDRTE